MNIHEGKGKRLVISFQDTINAGMYKRQCRSDFFVA